MGGGGGHHGPSTPLLDPAYPNYQTLHPSWIPRPKAWQVWMGRGLGAFCFGWIMIMSYKEWDHMTVRNWSRVGARSVWLTRPHRPCEYREFTHGTG